MLYSFAIAFDRPVPARRAEPRGDRVRGRRRAELRLVFVHCGYVPADHLKGRSVTAAVHGFFFAAVERPSAGVTRAPRGFMEVLNSHEVCSYPNLPGPARLPTNLPQAI
jgi:hypothetical protein